VNNLSIKPFLYTVCVLFVTLLLLSFQPPFNLISHAEAVEDGKSALSMLLGDSENDADEFLPPDVAFKLLLNPVSADTIQADFTVAPGYYLYRERIKFVVQNKSAVIGRVNLPKGEIKDDPNFGKQEVYHQSFSAAILLSNKTSDDIAIEATYQGCSEKGLCYAPIKKILNVNLQTPFSASNLSQATQTNSAPINENPNDTTANLLKTGNIWLIIAGFFVAGLLLSLTPCVLPMIPILSSIIVGSQSHSTSRLHAFALSVAYVLGMALSYTLAGIAAGLSGNLLSQSLQNPWVLGSSALVFVLLALSMFGFYELKLPQAFESKVLNTSNKFKGGKFIGVFVMGALSALIVSPCIAAPLAGALIYIGQSQNVALGGLALFSLSIGMGVPLLVIGASAGQLLPKTGSWMNAVRNFFGVLMLGMAIWLVSPVIPLSISFALTAALLIITAIYMNALDNLAAHSHGHPSKVAKFWKGIAVIMLIIGVAILIGALSGAKSILQPLKNITFNTAQTQPTEHGLNFKRIKNIAELNSEISAAKGKPVMLDFYADWCVACKELEKFTFSDANIQTLLKNTVLLQVDVSANSDDDKALLKRFALYGPPGIVFFDTNGQEINSIKTIGFQNAARFAETLNQRNSL